MNLYIISGRSGSGKSTVLHVLEDQGYFCIDNLPASLLPALARRISESAGEIANAAVSIDARNISEDLRRVPATVKDLRADGFPTKVIFLDANSQSLLKRFSESRRKHPLSSETVGLREAIERESELLEPISVLADLAIDTSGMSLQKLRDTIKGHLLDKQDTSLAITFLSFGYKNGVPVDADLVFDVRCLPNPYWDSALRSLTGLDEPVARFMEAQEEVSRMQADITRFLDSWLPAFGNNNRSYMTVALGCTGGQHRSVYLCERLVCRFRDRFPNVQVRHRELG